MRSEWSARGTATWPTSCGSSNVSPNRLWHVHVHPRKPRNVSIPCDESNAMQDVQVDEKQRVGTWSGRRRASLVWFGTMRPSPVPSIFRTRGGTDVDSIGRHGIFHPCSCHDSKHACNVHRRALRAAFVCSEWNHVQGFRAGACVCTTPCRPFRCVASFVRLLFVSDPRRSTSTRSCERGASRTTSAWTRGCASSCDSSELDRDRGQTRFDRGMGWEPGFLSNPDFLRFEPEIVSNQPSVSQPDPSDKVRGSSCQISHVASPPLSRLKPFLSCGVIILRCVVSETRGVRPPPDSGARRSEREREGERHTEREGGESESRIYRGGTVGVWTTIRTTRAANTHLRAANRPCDAACV